MTISEAQEIVKSQVEENAYLYLRSSEYCIKHPHTGESLSDWKPEPEAAWLDAAQRLGVN